LQKLREVVLRFKKLADTVSSYFVPIVVLIALLTFVIWALAGDSDLAKYDDFPQDV
jgi:cation transport ATPase